MEPSLVRPDLVCQMINESHLKGEDIKASGGIPLWNTTSRGKRLICEVVIENKEEEE